MKSKSVRFATALSALGDYYGKELSEGVIALYWQGLQQYEIEDIEVAIGRHLQNPDSGQWMPKIADIVRMLEGTTQSSAAMAWAKVMRAVGAVGQYQSIVFDDAVIHLAISDLGGWPHVCQTTEEELPFLQGRFEKNYRAYKVRGNDLPSFPRYMPGICEIQNSAMSLKSDPPLLVGDMERAKLVYQSGSDAPRLPVHVARSVGELGNVLKLVSKKQA